MIRNPIFHPSYGYATPEEMEALYNLPTDDRKFLPRNRILRSIARRTAAQKRKNCKEGR